MVTRTADGFLAAGEAPAGGGTTQAVVWTSPNGLTWHRTMGLTAPGGRALNISYATWHGADTVISGALSNGQSGVWLSTNGGTSWTPLTIPADHGAGPVIAGLGFDASGLIAIRDGRTPSGTQDGVSYFSPNGESWQYAATIGATGGLTPRVVKGQRLRLRLDRQPAPTQPGTSSPTRAPARGPPGGPPRRLAMRPPRR